MHSTRGQSVADLRHDDILSGPKRRPQVQQQCAVGQGDDDHLVRPLPLRRRRHHDQVGGQALLGAQLQVLFYGKKNSNVSSDLLLMTSQS